LRYLITPAFEAEIVRLIQDLDEEVARIGIDLAESTRSTRLLHRSLLTRAERRWGHTGSVDRFAEAVDPRTWMSWWEAADSDEVRSTLLGAVSPIPSIEVEQVLIGSLENPRLRRAAASVLEDIGSSRASAPLTRLLEEGLTGWDRMAVVRTIGRL